MDGSAARQRRDNLFSELVKRSGALVATMVVGLLLHGLISFVTGERLPFAPFLAVVVFAVCSFLCHGDHRRSLRAAGLPRAKHVLLLSAAYFLCGGLGSGLALIPGISITFWPPAGVFLAALLLTPPVHWPVYIFAAGFAELLCNDLWFHNSLPLALLYFSSNAAEALSAALLITTLAGRPFRLESFREAVAFAVGAGLAPVVGATAIASTDALLGKHAFTTAWPLVWLGDGSGLLVSTPVALGFVRAWHSRDVITRSRLLEAAALAVLFIGVGVSSARGDLTTPYLTVPLVLWAAVRFQIYGVAVAMALLTLTCAYFASHGVGEFAGLPEERHGRLVMLQTFLGITALSGLLTAILSLQRQKAVDALREANRGLEQRVRERSASLQESEGRLRMALEAAHTGLWTWDVRSNAVSWSEETYAIHGIRTDDFDRTEAGFFRLVHPEDVDRVRSTVRSAIDGRRIYESEFRIVRPDGAVRWVANLGRASWDEEGRPLSVSGTITDITERKLAEERSAVNLRAMTRLWAVGNRCARPSNDIDGCLMEVLEAAIELSGADQGTVQLRDAETGDLRIRAQQGFEASFLSHFQSVCMASGAACGTAMTEGRQVVVPDVEMSEVFRNTSSLQVLLGAGVRAVQSTPLISSTGQVLGMLSTHFRTPHHPSEEELRFMQLLARQAADYLERKWAEEEMRRRAEEFQVLLDTLPVGVFVAHDPNAALITGNRAAQDLLRTPQRNLSLSGAAGELPTNFQVRRNGVELPPEELPVQRAARGEVVVNEELEVFFDDGSVLNELISAAPLFDRDGRVRGAVAGVLDITARKRAEVERERVMATLNSFIASAPAGVALLDSEMRFQHINEPLAAMNGISVEAHLGRSVAEVVPDLYEAVKPVFDRVLSEGKPVPDFILEGDSPKHPGEKHVWRESWFPLPGADGRPFGVGVIVQEITEQRRLEQEREDNQRTLFELVERCPFGIYIVDEEFRIASVNAGSQDKAFANVRPLIGRPFDEAMRIIWPESVAAEVIERFRYTLATGEPYSSRDFLNPRADIDRTEGYEWELHRISMPGGRPGVVCYYFDSTRLRQVEHALKEADRKKDEFLATLAHELRNPLAPIRNGIQIMKLAGDDPDAVAQSRRILERQVEQMSRLVDDLMDLSRISRGKIILQKTRLRLLTALQDAVDTSLPLIERQGHELVLDVPNEAIFVEGDHTRLTQAFANLLNNAAKYTEREGRIRLGVRQRGGEVEIAIEDNGVGIPADMLPRVFDMFAQVDQSLEKAQGGLGIGLNIVKRLVEMHGGSVAVESAGHGCGSTFSVRLPVVEGAESGASENQAGEPVSAPRRRILVVDDNTDGAQSLALMLEIMGNEIQTAHDGLEAVSAAQAFRPDVILMDIGMPKMNGFDACRAIRAEAWGQDIIMVAQTGWGQEEDKQKARQAGFDLHMTKPVDPTELDRMMLDVVWRDTGGVGVANG